MPLPVDAHARFCSNRSAVHIKACSTPCAAAGNTINRVKLYSITSSDNSHSHVPNASVTMAASSCSCHFQGRSLSRDRDRQKLHTAPRQEAIIASRSGRRISRPVRSALPVSKSCMISSRTAPTPAMQARYNRALQICIAVDSCFFRIQYHLCHQIIIRQALASRCFNRFNAIPIQSKAAGHPCGHTAVIRGEFPLTDPDSGTSASAP